MLASMCAHLPLLVRFFARLTCLRRRDLFFTQKLHTPGIKSAYNYRSNMPDSVANTLAPWNGMLHTLHLFLIFSGIKCVLRPFPTSLRECRSDE